MALGAVGGSWGAMWRACAGNHAFVPDEPAADGSDSSGDEGSFSAGSANHGYAPEEVSWMNDL